MESAEFRRHGHAIVDWIADYLDGVGQYPVLAPAKPGATAAQVPATPPEDGEPMERILADFERIVMPGITHWQHPRFFAYFPANSSRPSVLAETLTAALGAQCMSWETSPAATELEERMMVWLRVLLGLPESFVGSIQDTASTATLCAILAARERATDSAVNERGAADAGCLVAYCSEEAHSAVEKDVMIAGIGRANLRRIPVDDELAMRASVLEDTIVADREAGCRPVCVVATLGTTGAGGFDPLRPIGEICRRHGVWLHVDAAWAGSALVLPETRSMIDGIELVDSFVFNPHKWLFTNFDCSALFVRDRDEYVRTFEILPEYLKTRQGTTVTNYRDWGIQLGRRFRALKLWFVLRSYGASGLRRLLRSHIDMVRALGDEIAGTPDFEVLRPPALSLLCFRFRPAGRDDGELDVLNERLLHAVNDRGSLYLSHTRLRGRYAIRFVVGQTQTTERDVTAAWEEIVRTARGLG